MSTPKSRERDRNYRPSDFNLDANKRYLASGRTPGERAATYNKSKGTVRRTPLTSARHKKLQTEESDIIAFAKSKPGKEIGQTMMAQHGAKPDPDLQGADAHKRAPGTTTVKTEAPKVTMTDPAKESTKRRSTRTQKSVAKAVRKGTNPIAGFGNKARAALKANSAGLEHNEASIVSTRAGAKASEKDHLQPKQSFPSGGRHHAPSATGAKKNAYGSMNAVSTGRHSSEPYVGKHRGSYDATADAHRTALQGSISYGKHSAEYRKMTSNPTRGWFEPATKAA